MAKIKLIGSELTLTSGVENTPIIAHGFATPTLDTDAANKKYVDDAVAGATPTGFLPTTGGTMSGDINMGGNNITNLPSTPVNDSDAVSKQYTDEKIQSAINEAKTSFSDTYLPLTGGTMAVNAKIQYQGATENTNVGITYDKESDTFTIGALE